MPRFVSLPVLLLALTAAPAAPAAEVAKLPVTVTNASERLADCAVLIDGRIKYYVKIKPGDVWTDSFQTIRELKLVCERSREYFFGPLKLGGAYRILEVKKRLEIEPA